MSVFSSTPLLSIFIIFLHLTLLEITCPRCSSRHPYYLYLSLFLYVILFFFLAISFFIKTKNTSKHSVRLLIFHNVPLGIYYIYYFIISTSRFLSIPGPYTLNIPFSLLYLFFLILAINVLAAAPDILFLNTNNL